MIIKEIRDTIVVSATHIKSFHVSTDENNKATITVIKDDIHNSEALFSQSPGDHHIYHVVDDNNNMIRLIHQ